MKMSFATDLVISFVRPLHNGNFLAFRTTKGDLELLKLLILAVFFENPLIK